MEIKVGKKYKLNKRFVKEKGLSPRCEGAIVKVVMDASDDDYYLCEIVKDVNGGFSEVDKTRATFISSHQMDKI